MGIGFCDDRKPGWNQTTQGLQQAGCDASPSHAGRCGNVTNNDVDVSQLVTKNRDRVVLGVSDE